MADATVDVTKAPAKILSVSELKNGSVWVATEGKIYQFIDGKLRPVIFADVEHEAVAAGSKPAPVGAVPAAPAPPAPVKAAADGPALL
jgi:predicted amidohydrolase